VKTTTVAALACFLAAAATHFEWFDGVGVGTARLPDVAEPAAALQTAVEPVRAALKGRDGAAILAWYYYDFANMVDDSVGPEETTAQLREMNADGVRFGVGGAFDPVPGLADKIEAVLIGHLGAENKPVDEATKRKVVEAFSALAWAAKQAAQ